MNALGALLEAERAKRDMTLTEFARDVLGVEQSLVSRYVNGRLSPGRHTIRKIAAALGLEPAAIEELIPDPRRGAHEPGLGPTGRADTDELRAGIAEVLEELRRIRAGTVPARVAWAGPGVYEQPAIPGVREKLEPLRVPDDALLGQGIRADSIAWVDPVAAPRPGDVVRVGLDGDARLTVYADGVPATGVVRLVQTTF